MTECFLQILNMSISATWLVLAVLALRLVLRKAPRWIYVLLWGLVAFRLACPFTLESALSLIPSTQTISPEIMLDPTPTVHTGVESLNQIVNPVISETFAPEPLTSANPLQILLPILSVLWILGMAAMLMYTLISYLRLRHKVRTAIRVKENIYLSEFVLSPFVLGLFRPRIYLPYHMEESDRVHVIAHERAHIRRRDHWWKPLGFLLLTVHWFNPLLWLAYILLCRDIELACDERVIRKLSADQRADYSEALLHCAIPHRTIAACPLAFGEAGIRERVKNILHYRKPTFRILVLCLILILILSVCFLTNPPEDTPVPPETTGNPPAAGIADIHIGLFIDRITANSMTLTFLTDDTLPDGEYHYVSAIVQARENSSDWTDVISIKVSPTGKDIRTDSSSVTLEWQEANYRLTQGTHRLVVQIRQTLPDGTIKYHTLREQFDPATYAWGVTTAVSDLSQEDGRLALTLQHSANKDFPDGALTISHNFSLEKRDNGQWIDMGEPLQEVPDTQHPISGKTFQETEKIGLNTYFGDLQNGTYRLVKYVTRHHSDGTAETRPIYAVFTVDAVPTAHISLGTAKVDSPQLSLDTIPEDFTLEEATELGFVTFVDLNLHSNAQLWQDFLQSTRNGTPATLRIMLYYNLGNKSQYAPELYESIKDDYPQKFYYEIRYNGTDYEVIGYNGGEKFEKHYKYLRHFTGPAISDTATYDYYEDYILTNDRTATWEEIFLSTVSSQHDAYIDHFTVYFSRLSYPDPVKAELVFDGQVLSTVTDPHGLKQLQTMFLEAIPAEAPDPLPLQDLRIDFTDENGEICTYLASTQDDLCWIGESCYDYGPDDARETLFRCFGIHFADPDILAELRTPNESQRLTQAILHLKEQSAQN